MKISLKTIHGIQRKLSERLVFRDHLPNGIRYVAGVDVAYHKERSIGAVSVLEFPELQEVETEISVTETRFPYIPTLLGFRETPAVVAAIKKIRIEPQVFLVDGHGYSHPQHFGFACHLGFITGKPTIGVAKAILYGEMERNGSEDLRLIKEDDDVIGAALKIKNIDKPIFVSVGNMITLSTALEIVKKCVKSSRIPEPIRCAHLAASRWKRRLRI